MSHFTIRNINFSYEKIVIGSSLEALLYSYYNNVPFVCVEIEYPNRFSYFDIDTDLSQFGLKNETQILTAPTTEKKIGINKSWLWERLYLCLSLAGLNPLSDKVASLRIDESALKVFTHKARSAVIKYKQLIVFAANGIMGLPPPISIPQKKYKVYDWINVRSGSKHEFDLIEDLDTLFVHNILFYPTERVDGEQIYKDACAISYLSEEKLSDFEYSDINARFKILQMMKEAGIKGPRNGYDLKDKTKVKYRGVKIETSHRDIELLKYPKYESTNNIEFNYSTFDDILKQNYLKESYVAKLYKRTHC